MKTMKVFFGTALLSLLSLFTSAQVTSIPEAAKENFAKQYPEAKNVEWDNDVVNVNVRFDINDEHMNAEYSNKGIWKSTVKDYTYDQLPAAVQEGFKKSKYADRKVTETKVVYYPGNVEQYRIKTEKNDLQKKYLFFNEDGRLIRDAITI